MKLHVIFFVTPQRRTLRQTRTIFSDNTDFEHFSNVIEEDENEIDSMNDNDYVPDDSDNSDRSIKFFSNIEDKHGIDLNNNVA